MARQQITDPDRRGRKPKEESRAEELHEKLPAWRQIPESSRPSLRTDADNRHKVDTPAPVAEPSCPHESSSPGSGS